MPSNAFRGRATTFSARGYSLPFHQEVSYQQVQRYENGTNLLNTEKLQLIADSLEVPVGYFFEGYDVAAEFPASYQTSDEAKIVRLYRKLDGRYKKCFLMLLEK